MPCRRCPFPCLPWTLASISATAKHGDGKSANLRKDAQFEAGGPGDSASDMTFSLKPRLAPRTLAVQPVPSVKAVHESLTALYNTGPIKEELE